VLYDKRILISTFNILKLMTDCDNELFLNNYIDGLNIILLPTNHAIRNWIQANLTL
jgi:hypothetical protein